MVAGCCDPTLAKKLGCCQDCVVPETIGTSSVQKVSHSTIGTKDFHFEKRYQL